MKIKKRLRSLLKNTKDLIIPTKSVFNGIYKANHWGDMESISGPGSRVDATENLRKELIKLFDDLKIKSLIDAPCGDFNWMKLIDLGNIKYTGIDIVKEIIINNNSKYANRNITFYNLNFLTDRVPQGDLILCRDCLPHFSNINVKKAIKNFKLSNSKYLLTSSYPECENNTDIVTGEWRKINFNLDPFNFPKPLSIINEKSPLNLENGQNFDKCLFLWELSDLKVI